MATAAKIEGARFHPDLLYSDERLPPEPMWPQTAALESRSRLLLR